MVLLTAISKDFVQIRKVRLPKSYIWNQGVFGDFQHLFLNDLVKNGAAFWYYAFKSYFQMQQNA